MGHFLPFYTLRNQNLKKMKKTPGDIIFHICAKNYDQMMYCSWDMGRDRRTDGRKKWHIEVDAPHKNLLRMAFKIPFTQASRCLTGVDSYTVLETKKLEKLVGGILLQYLHLGIMEKNLSWKKYFVNIETKREKNFQRKSRF